nr:Metallophosphoesterase domain containing protein [Haemonchus contortus]
MAAKKVPPDDINSTPAGITDHEDDYEDDDDDESSRSIDSNDIFHDDLVADLLIRILNSPLIDDPHWIRNDNNRNTVAPAFLKFDISFDEVVQLCAKASASFLAQSALLTIEKAELPVHVVADLHGNLPQVLRVFRYCGIPQKETFLFLGDYVDRGVQGIEVITFLFCLKIRYPYQVYLLRGNHEDANTTLNYGFFDECVTRWPSTEQNAPGVKAFNCMPVAAIIADTIFCAHGGISPFIDKLDDINKIRRPSVVPAYGIGCDLVWSDPALQRDGWVLSHRGISFLFGPKAVEDFCAKHHLDIILRGHQISNEMYKNGYRISFDGRLVTLFSAPNYMNYKNNSCVLTVTKKLQLSFTVFRCRYYQFGKKRKVQNGKDVKKGVAKKGHESEHIADARSSPCNSAENICDSMRSSLNCSTPKTPGKGSKEDQYRRPSLSPMVRRQSSTDSQLEQRSQSQSRTRQRRSSDDVTWSFYGEKVWSASPSK